MSTVQTNLKNQDSTAERLKTFKMRKHSQIETVTNTPEGPFNFNSVKSTTHSGSSVAPSSRPSSHHRRRSSVSTRRESAEIMGVSPATLAELPTSDDSDTNNLRRRALWALEGRREDGSQVNVGVYNKVEIPELLSRMERVVESDRRPQASSNSSKRDSLGRERDSYGRVISQALSLKDQLHTLLEEDEEEDCSPSEQSSTKSSFNVPPSTLTPSIQPTSAPTSLSNRHRLKPLTLSTSSPLVSTNGQPPSRSLSELAAKRPSSTSLQFIRYALPTPESTPTTSERPLSPSEQAFLFNNQASLLSRISELERVLASRSRPVSSISASSRQLSTSSFASEVQSDEMLRMIQDLKAERDDLCRDLSLSQSKAENLENQISLLNRRVEAERREAWLAKQNEQALRTENVNLSKELDKANQQIVRLKEDLARSQPLAAKTQMFDVFHAHRKDDSLPRSVPEQGGFPEDVATKAGSDEEDDELAHYEDEDVGDVSFYSDQDDSTSSTSPYGYGQDNLLTPAVAGRLMPSPSSVASISPPQTPLSVPAAPHKRSSSLEQGWSFPKGARTFKTEPLKVDRFFDCLEDLDNEDLASCPFEMAIEKEQSQDKYGFFSGEQDEDEDDFPFILPSQFFPSVPKPEISAGRSSSQAVASSPPLTPSSPSVHESPLCNRVALGNQQHSPSSQTPPSFLTSTTGLYRKLPVPDPNAPQLTRSPNAKHVGPSLIPKPSPVRNDATTAYPATPTSVPRVKISPVSPQAATKPGSSFTKSPTKLPQPRVVSTNTHSSKLFTLECMVRGKRSN